MSRASWSPQEAEMTEAESAARGVLDSTAQGRPQHGTGVRDGSRSGRVTAPPDVSSHHVVTGAHPAVDGGRAMSAVSDVGALSVMGPIGGVAADVMGRDTPGFPVSDQRSVSTAESAPQPVRGQDARSESGRAASTSSRAGSSRAGGSLAPGTQYSRVSKAVAEARAGRVCGQKEEPSS